MSADTQAHQPLGKFIDTTSSKRPDMKDSRSVKQQNRRQGLGSGSLGPLPANTLNSTSNAGSDNNTEPGKRARSINSKNKLPEHDSSLFLDGKRTVPHDKSFTEHLEEKNRMSY